MILATVDPRAFALHKLWMSKRDEREPIKRRRDQSQASVVAQLCHQYFNLPFDSIQLAALPEELREGLKTLSHATTLQEDEPPEPNW